MKPNTLLAKAGIPIAIVFGAILLSFLLSALKSRPMKTPPAEIEKIPVVVESVTATPARIPLEGYGTLEAREQIHIVSEVTGRVVETHPELEAGLKLTRGELIFRITDDEYRHRLDIDKANLAKAEFDLKEEQGRGLVAQREWKLLDKRLKNSSLSKELALREAHEEQKLAAKQGAEGSVKLAELNVERTQVNAPCDGVVLAEQIGVGQFINQGAQVATFACTDALRLIVSLPPNQLRWITPIEPLKQTANANVEGHPANLVRLLSNVDQRTRMIQLLFELPGSVLEHNLSETPPLLLGAFSRVTFTAESPSPVFTIPADSIRNNNEIWVFEEGELAIRSVRLLHRFEDQAMIEIEGQPRSIQLITSYLNAPYQGMPLELKQPLETQTLNEDTLTRESPESANTQGGQR